jgi:predicted nucleic acid-binding Zn ribbon protein
VTEAADKVQLAYENMMGKPKTCRVCHLPIKQSNKGRPRKTCSEDCARELNLMQKRVTPRRAP